MELKRKCSHCNKVKIINVDKKPPICRECFKKIKHDKNYLIKLDILILIILFIFVLSFLIK